ncbi:acyl-CoA dehydrogenase family protein [Alcanivorax sp. ZXX171]|nr:acyl-CoA dehydrogenase family protein [Alcanivorax sp. ZXX171]
MSTLNQETRAMLADSVDRFIRTEYSFEDRRRNLEQHQGQSPEHWRTFVEMGWLAIPFAEEQGGFGGEITDTVSVLKGFGRGMVTEPYPGVLIAARLLALAGQGDQRESLLAGVLAGDRQVVFASEGAQGRGNPLAVGVAAEADGTGYRLSGRKVAVPFSRAASHVVVSARGNAGDTDETVLELFLMPLDSAGIEVVEYPMMDGHQGANLAFNGVTVSQSQQLTSPGAAGPLVRQAHAEANLLLAAEAVGIMDTLVRKTVAYTQTRKQFGVALAEFQVLQHRMADMYIEATSIANLLTQTAARWPSAAPEQRLAMASRLKARLGPAARYVGQQAVQLHGGIGITNELDIGHYFKRLTSIELQGGNAEWHRKTLWRDVIDALD